MAKITVPLLGISLVVQRLVDVERVSGGRGAGGGGWPLGPACRSCSREESVCGKLGKYAWWTLRSQGCMGCDCCRPLAV